MTAIHFDANIPDVERRGRLYNGELFIYSPTAESRELVAFARKMLTHAFAPHDPELAQFSMPVEAYAGVLGELKPKFIHHPECKRLLPASMRLLGDWNWWLPFVGVQRRPPALAEYGVEGSPPQPGEHVASDGPLTDAEIGGKR